MKYQIVYNHAGQVVSMAAAPASASKLQYGPVASRRQKVTTLDVPQPQLHGGIPANLNQLRVTGTTKKPQLIVRPPARPIRKKKRKAKR